MSEFQDNKIESYSYHILHVQKLSTVMEVKKKYSEKNVWLMAQFIQWYIVNVQFKIFSLSYALYALVNL